MRILHVLSTGTRRGAEMFAADLIPLLGKLGFSQEVAVLYGSPPYDVAFAAPSVALAPGERIGFKTHYRIVKALIAEIRRFSPDVIHAHGGDALKYCVIASHRARIPIVYRNIGLAAPWATVGARRTMYSWLMRHAARVIAVADTVREQTIGTFGVPDRRVITIPSTVAPGRVQTSRGRAEVRRSLEIDPEAPVMLSLTALTWEKNPVAHVDLAARVLRQEPGVIHLIAGDGPMRDEVHDQIAKRDLEGRIRLLGTRSDVADLLCASDVMIFASRADGMEGMPGILIEAGMAGVPAVAYAVAGASEVIIDGETGILVPSGDIDALASAVLELLRSPEKRSSMGESARKTCLSRFDVNSYLPEFVSLYADVADSY